MEKTSPIFIDLISQVCDFINNQDKKVIMTRIQKEGKIVDKNEICQQLLKLQIPKYDDLPKGRSTRTPKRPLEDSERCTWLKKGSQRCDKPRDKDKETGYCYIYCKDHMRSKRGKTYKEELLEKGELNKNQNQETTVKNPIKSKPLVKEDGDLFSGPMHPLGGDFFRLKSNDMILQRQENNHMKAIAIQEFHVSEDGKETVTHRPLKPEEEEIAREARFKILEAGEEIPDIPNSVLSGAKQYEIPQIPIISIPAEEVQAKSLKQYS